jgi:aspartyl-tRNA(Asn)/glutamyl-tRNA(Gln) amidotransferase subunit A
MGFSGDLNRSSLAAIRNAVVARDVSATEVTKHFLSRIEKLDGKLNSFITVNDQALSEAKTVDDRLAKGESVGSLAGIPVAIKDLLCTKGLKTTAGSKILEGFIPPYSASVVERLKKAGATVLGKTNLDEFAMGSSNETSAFGVARNPWNPEYVPGGSSGGSAAALAARLAPAAIGTDTGGSIRQPASFCGVYGIKPTYGRVSRYGIIAYASSLDQAGPMGLTTEDCAIMLEAIAGKCQFDSTSADVAVPSWSEELKQDLKGVRIGLPKEYFSEAIDPEVVKVTERAIEALKSCGATFVDISLSLVKHAVPIYYLIATSEASSNLARYDGVRFGYRSNFQETPASDLESFYSRNRGEAFGAEVKRRIMLGTYALSSGYYDAYYQKACQVRRLLRDEFLRAFHSCDLILSPVTTTPAFKIGARVSDPLTMYLNDIFTTSTNLAGLPGMSVPAGYSKAGLPIGVQLMAKHFDEQSIFNASSALEKMLQLEERTPDVF